MNDSRRPWPTLRQVLVAHRGEPGRFPENTRAGFESALTAGARYIETDIQISADGVPVLSHDASLLRVTGHDLVIPDTAFEHFHHLPAAEPERFGRQFTGLRLARLDELVELLSAWPQVEVFVELKSDSFARFGAAMVRTVLDTVAPIAGRCTLISFDADALQIAAGSGTSERGWVLPEWSADTRAQAEQLQPEYLFVNRKRIPATDTELWSGKWRWVGYTANTERDIRTLLERGCDLVETNNISALLGTTTMS